MRGKHSHRPDFHSSVDEEIEQEKIDWLFIVKRGGELNADVEIGYFLKYLEHKKRLKRLYARRSRELHKVTSNRNLPWGDLGKAKPEQGV